LWAGWQLGDRYTSLWGSPIDMKALSDLLGNLRSRAMGSQFLSSFDLSESKMDEFIKSIEAFKPKFFLAYPGPLEQFAMHCKKRGVQFPFLKAIVSSAETLWPHQLELIEDSFGVKVFNRYGSREVGQIASECEMRNGLHVSADRMLVEVVDSGGRPCAPGEVGQILITDLDNYGMPLIRYDIGDRAVPAENQKCSCGRGLPLLQKVEGRTMEIVRTPDGRQIGGTFWTLLLRSRPAFHQFQVVQEVLEGVVIKYVKGADFDASSLNYFAAKIREYCGDDFNVVFSETDSIDLTASGKQRLILSMLAAHPESAKVPETVDVS
jgi:phenylacetate-CoA ligase